MTSDSIPVQDLDVIGYADVVPPELWPRVVPPVFQRRDAPGEAFAPPSRVEGARLVMAHRLTRAEFDAAVARAEATALGTPPAARPAHVLWLDEEGRARYEPAERVAEHLKRLSRERQRAAEDALVARRHEDAARLAQTALNADVKNLAALLVKGVVAREIGREQRLAVLRRVAASVDADCDFAARLAAFAESLQRRRFRAAFDPALRPVSGRPVRQFDALAPAA